MTTPPTDTNASTTDSTGRDRRRFARHGFVRPCKVQRIGGVQFEPGETTNISAGGALIRIAGRRAMGAGEQIRVGVAWESAGVLTSGSLLPARVVRVVAIDHHHQAVAVQYERPISDATPIASSTQATMNARATARAAA